MTLRLPLLLLSGLWLLVSAAASSRQPDILWLITDDQRADSIAAHNRAVSGKSESPLGHVESPALDALAADGVLFTRAYCNSPGCVPSRISMHTGRYPHHCGVYGFNRCHQEPDFVRPTVPQLMIEQGYSTSHFGKQGYYIFEWGPGLTWNNLPFYQTHVDMKNDLQAKGLTDFWKNKSWQKGGKTVEEEIWFLPDGSKHSYRTDEPAESDTRTRRKIEEQFDILRSYTRDNPNLIIGGRSPQGPGGTLDAHIARSFREHLAGPVAKDDKPQFFHLSFHLPHTPVLPPQEFRDRFKGCSYKVPAFDKDRELAKLPPQLRQLYEKMQIDDLKPDEMQQAIRDYYAFCAYGDSLIGKSVDAFRKSAEKRNRPWLVLIACGDHGWHLGENGIEAKFGPYDMSSRCGVIAVASNRKLFPPGTVYGDFVEFVDFAPTMLKAAGGDLSSEKLDHLDGLDLAGLVSGKIPARAYALGECNHVYGPRAYLRTENFAFSMKTRPKWGEIGARNPGENIRWGLDAPYEKVEPALFDLRSDPGERFNLALDPRYAKLGRALRNKLANIVLGDGRIECTWAEKNTYTRSDFAPGAHDKKLPDLLKLVSE